MKKYLTIMRLDHWIKQFFIVPGIVCAFLLTKITFDVANLIAGFLATCLIASANYVINEYLDAEFDRHHPTKKFRAAVKYRLGLLDARRVPHGDKTFRRISND